MTKFTPGPWHIGPDYLDDEGHREIAIVAANGRGGYCTPASVVLQFPQVVGMQDANAYLIAAAPELYEALRRVREELWEPTKATLDLTDAALAKARGEQS